MNDTTPAKGVKIGVVMGSSSDWETMRHASEILAELHEMADHENASWSSGQCSGTMYCGDMEHYAFLNEAFGLFAHQNALQRDMCPSATKFEGEVIAMALNLMHAGEVTDSEPAGLVTSGGTGSILHAMLSYRDHAKKTRGITNPNMVKPETAHPAFVKAAHLFGIELRVVPVDPATTLVDPAVVAEAMTRMPAPFRRCIRDLSGRPK